jgi:lysophospholipase L1-like esterase
MQRHLRSCAVRQHAVYLSASDWIPEDDCFEDATHLNEKGAQLFSRKLAAALSSDAIN